MTGRRAAEPLGRVIAAAAGPAILCFVAVLPLRSVFDETDFWVAGVGGVLLGGGIGVLAARRGSGALVTAALTVGAYFVFGGGLAVRSTTMFGMVPTPDTLRELALGIVFAWKRVLTVSTPVDGIDGLLIVPFAAALVVSVLAVSLGLRLRREGWAVLPSAALLLFAICFSSYDAFAPVVIGGAFAALAAAWTAWRRTRGDTPNLAETSATVRTPRLLGLGAGSLVVALATGLTAGAAVQPPVDRVVLRDVIVPPLEVHDYASPLTQFRKFMSDGEDSTLFTIDGLPDGARIRLATLDQYDGVVYRVSGDGSAAGGAFERVGRQITSDVAGEPAELTVTVGDLRGVWLPDAGSATRIRLAEADERADALHYNSATGTTVLTSGLAEGDVYTVDALIPAVPDDEQLAGAEVSPITVTDPQRVPEVAGVLVAEVTEGTTTVFEQLSAIESRLHDQGFYSNGLEGQVASRSGHRSERIGALLEGKQMIGDEEQYAVAMALMAAQVGVPARVVMGFRPENGPQSAPSGGPLAVTAADASVWVEVPFEGFGWVPFDPTPPKDRVPQEEVPEPAQKPQAQVLQPPPPPQAPVDLPPEPPAEESQNREQPLDLGWLWTALRWTGIGLAVIVVLLGPAIAMAVAKALRRTRRARAGQPADRMSGGWAELHDVALDHGGALPEGATRREQVPVLEQRFPGPAYAELAGRADVAVFGAGDPDGAEVAAYWADVRTATGRLGRGAGWRARLRGFLLPRSVLRDLRAELARRTKRRGS